MDFAESLLYVLGCDQSCWHWTSTYHLTCKTLMSACPCQVGLLAEDLGVQLSTRGVVHHNTPQHVEGRHLGKGFCLQGNPTALSISSNVRKTGLREINTP